MNQIPSASQILLRPLTLIISCTIFVILILVMGLIDLNRLDRSLVNFMEVRGLDVAEKIERESQVGFNSIMQMLRGESAGETLIPLTDETFLTQESLIKALVSVIRAIDGRWPSQTITPEEAKGVIEKEGLWLLAIVDEGGRVLFQSRPVPRQVLVRAEPAIRKKRISSSTSSADPRGQRGEVSLPCGEAAAKGRSSSPLMTTPCAGGACGSRCSGPSTRRGRRRGSFSSPFSTVGGPSSAPGESSPHRRR
jgi:hypothetical protein